MASRKDLQRLFRLSQTSQHLPERVRELEVRRMALHGLAQPRGRLLVVSRGELERRQAPHHLQVFGVDLGDLRIGGDRTFGVVECDLRLTHADERAVVPGVLRQHLLVDLDLAFAIAGGATHAGQPAVEHEAVRVVVERLPQHPLGVVEALHALVDRGQRHAGGQILLVLLEQRLHQRQRLVCAAALEIYLVEQHASCRADGSARLVSQHSLDARQVVMDPVEPAEEEPPVEVVGIELEPALGVQYRRLHIVRLSRQPGEAVVEIGGGGILLDGPPEGRASFFELSIPGGELADQEVVLDPGVGPHQLARAARRSRSCVAPESGQRQRGASGGQAGEQQHSEARAEPPCRAPRTPISPRHPPAFDHSHSIGFLSRRAESLSSTGNRSSRDTRRARRRSRPRTGRSCLSPARGWSAPRRERRCP